MVSNPAETPPITWGVPFSVHIRISLRDNVTNFNSINLAGLYLPLLPALYSLWCPMPFGLFRNNSNLIIWSALLTSGCANKDMICGSSVWIGLSTVNISRAENQNNNSIRNRCLLSIAENWRTMLRTILSKATKYVSYTIVWHINHVL